MLYVIFSKSQRLQFSVSVSYSQEMMQYQKSKCNFGVTLAYKLYKEKEYIALICRFKSSVAHFNTNFIAAVTPKKYAYRPVQYG